MFAQLTVYMLFYFFTLNYILKLNLIITVASGLGHYKDILQSGSFIILILINRGLQGGSCSG